MEGIFNTVAVNCRMSCQKTLTIEKKYKSIFNWVIYGTEFIRHVDFDLWTLFKSCKTFEISAQIVERLCRRGDAFVINILLGREEVKGAS